MGAQVLFLPCVLCSSSLSCAPLSFHDFSCKEAFAARVYFSRRSYVVRPRLYPWRIDVKSTVTDIQEPIISAPEEQSDRRSVIVGK